MAVLQGDVELIDTQEEVVYSEDPCVDCGGKWGFLKKSEATRVDAGADVLLIRSLLPGQLRKARDAIGMQGWATSSRTTCTLGVKRANKRKDDDKEKWLDWVEQRNAMYIDLLAKRIQYISNGQPLAAYHEEARRLLGYPLPGSDEDEEGGDDAASKSPPEAG